MAAQAQHFADRRPALRNPDRYSLARGLGAPAEPGVGTWPREDAAEDRVARGVWNLLSALFLQLPIAGGAPERHHSSAVHCATASLLPAHPVAERPGAACENVTHYLSSCFQPRTGLHSAGRFQRGTATHEELHAFGHLSELPRGAPALLAQCQCTPARDLSAQRCAAFWRQHEHLPIQLRRGLPAEPTDRQFSRQRGNEGFAVRVLFVELLQQRSGCWWWGWWWRQLLRRRFVLGGVHHELLRSHGGLGPFRVRC